MSAPKFTAEYLSTRQAADSLGVSLRTVQLWVDADLIHAGRTPGGHRRLHVAHVDLLARHIRAGRNMPRTDEYEMAEADYNNDPATWRQLKVQRGSAPLAPVVSQDVQDLERFLQTWHKLLAAHQTVRRERGEPLIELGETGYIRKAADVTEHAWFKAGVQAALRHLTGLPEVKGG